MTTSQEMSLRSAISLEDTRLPPWQLGYFTAAAQDDAHALVVRLFLEMAEAKEVSRALFARRLGKKPEQITRWLAAPGNWTIETLSSLLLALGHRPTFSSESLADLRESNYKHPAVMEPEVFKEKIFRQNIEIHEIETQKGSLPIKSVTNASPSKLRQVRDFFTIAGPCVSGKSLGGEKFDLDINS